MKKANYVIFDVETGGLDYTKNPITQIALLAIDGNTLKEIERFEMYIKPYNDLVIGKEALQITGLKIADINNGYAAKEAVKLLMQFFKKVMPNNRAENRPILVGHNVSFDIGFIQYLFEFCGKDIWDFVNEVVEDTMKLTKQAFPETTSLKLAYCCELVGIRLKDAHKAMNDVLATTDLLKVYINRLRNSEVSFSGDQDKEKSRLKFQF